MQNVYIAKTCAFSSLGENTSQILESLYLGKGAVIDNLTTASRVIENDMPGRIPFSFVEKFEFKNKVVKNGPIEARFAYMVISFLLDNGLAEKVKGSDIGLFCGTMNNRYGVVGLRNGYRICATKDLQYDKEYFEQRIETGFSFVHPMVPVYKIPNNGIANIALDFELSGENANFFGEDSSGVALQTAYERIQYGILNEALAFSANHLFLNYLDFFFYEIKGLFGKPASLNPEIDNHFFPTESASAFYLATQSKLEEKKLKPLAEIIYSYQTSVEGEFYSRQISKDSLVSFLNFTKNNAPIPFEELDLILFDNLERNNYQIAALEEVLAGLNKRPDLLTASNYMGHSICANSMLQVALALEILHSGKLFSAYPKPDQAGIKLNNLAQVKKIKTVAILNQSLNQTLQLIILKGVEGNNE